MTIICATDFSDAAECAERQAVELARAIGADLVFVHVAVETPLYGESVFAMADVNRVYEAQRQWAETALRERVARVQAQGVSARMTVRSGVPFEQIVEAAKDEKADMIVIGTHGRTGLHRFLLGSVAERVIRMAPCPVLTVRPAPER